MTAQSAIHLPRRLKVFLCHASGDKPTVRELYHRLHGAGFDPWLDEDRLLGGQNWDLEIRRAVRSSDAVIICLSHRAITKAGYVHKEMKYALDVADEQPEGAIFLIPLRLEECEVPERLRALQWVNLFQEDGYERLLGALSGRAESLGLLGVYCFEPEMVLVPAGEFLMGSNPEKDDGVGKAEQPQHSVYLPDYCVAKAPVTNAQYARFVQASFRQPKHWEGGKPPRGTEDHPVVNVSWHDAVAYCNWLAEFTGKPYRLPSEAEWEKGARGIDGRIYPWGNKWDPKRCNSEEAGIGDTTQVGAYPEGASPYGLLDTAGNVWEWTRSLYRDYRYDPDDGREDLDASGLRAVRGGSWSDNGRRARCAYRIYNPPSDFHDDVGFRVCVVVWQD